MEFKAGTTKVGTAIDGAIKIFTVAVCIFPLIFTYMHTCIFVCNIFIYIYMYIYMHIKF